MINENKVPGVMWLTKDNLSNVAIHEMSRKSGNFVCGEVKPFPKPNKNEHNKATYTTLERFQSLSLQQQVLRIRDEFHAGITKNVIKIIALTVTLN